VDSAISEVVLLSRAEVCLEYSRVRFNHGKMICILVLVTKYRFKLKNRKRRYYFRFLNSIVPSGVVRTNWKPTSTNFVASSVFRVALHVHSSLS
jgi:hypothetical protein